MRLFDEPPPAECKWKTWSSSAGKKRQAGGELTSPLRLVALSVVVLAVGFLLI